jgi:hypothetical protein
VPNPATGGAVWKVAVEGPGYRHTLTVLRFRLDMLYVKDAHRPAAFDGRVIADLSAVNVVSPPTGAMPVVQGESEASAPPSPDIAKPATDTSTDPRFLAHQDTAIAAAAEERMATLPPSTILKPVAVALPFPDEPRKQARDVPPAAARFMNWLQVGLANGEVLYNQSEAMVHFVEDGMLLVSPAIFKAFAEKFGESGEGQADMDPAPEKRGAGIQRDVLKAGWHRKNAGTNIWRYQVVSRGVAGASLNGVLIEHPETFVSPVPAANPHLRKAAVVTTLPQMGRK